MDTPLHDFSGLSEQTIELLWFRTDQIVGTQAATRDPVFDVVLAHHRSELKVAALQLAILTANEQIQRCRDSTRPGVGLGQIQASLLRAATS